MNDIQLRKFIIGNSQPLTLMGGMNVLESRDLALRVAEEFKSASDKLEINYIFKGSFDKANRSSVSSFRGPGMEEGLKILQEISDQFDIPVITDIHEPDQAQPVSDVYRPGYVCLTARSHTPSAPSGFCNGDRCVFVYLLNSPQSSSALVSRKLYYFLSDAPSGVWKIQ